MSYLVFDIETAGKPWEEFDKNSKKIFKEWAKRESKGEDDLEKALEEVKKGFPLSPFLGEVVTISVLDDQGKGGVYFQAPGSDLKDFEEGDIKYRIGEEKDILEKFWDVARHYTRFVSFNGRGFDVPYLMTRSAIHKVKPTQNLMSNRYLSMQRGAQHIDLQDQLTFYGAIWRKPKLHFAVEAFGITSPKSGGMDGAEVPQAFRDGRYEEIARYCLADVEATLELYERWNEYMNI